MSKRTIGVLSVLGSASAYALLPPISFLLFDEGVKSGTILFGKFFIASVLLWIYILKKKIPFLPAKGQIKILLETCISYIVLSTLIYMAYDYISGSLAMLIQFTYPALLVMWNWIKKLEKIKKSTVIAVILSLLGVFCAVYSPNMTVTHYIGVLFAFLSAVFQVGYVSGISKNSKEKMNSNPIVITAYVMSMSSAFNFFRCLLMGDALFATGYLSMIYMLILGIVCAFFAIVLFAIGVKLLGASEAGIIGTSEVVLVCVFSYLILGDIITFGIILGGVLILVAILLISFTKKQ